MTYKIFAALRDDINNGWIWVAKPAVSGRTVVRVLNRENNTSIYCEALAIDENFLRIYNSGGRLHISDVENAMVLNDWYRNRLGGLTTQNDYALVISIEEHLLGRARSCVDHPQIVVR